MYIDRNIGVVWTSTGRDRCDSQSLVIAANPVARLQRAVDRAPVDLTIAEEKPVLSQISAPTPAVDVTRPVRVQPATPKPDLRVELGKPDVAKPVVPAAVARPVLTRSDAAATNPSKTPAPELRIDADAAKPDIASPAAPTARPVLTSAPSKVSASESVRLDFADEQIARPNLPVQGPIVVTDAPASDDQTSDNQAPNNPASDASSLERSALDQRASSNAPNLGVPDRKSVV